MDQNRVGLAFAAGMLAALNPCGFAMLPAYLALVVNGEEAGRVTAVGRALVATLAMALGFLVVFGIFGLLTVSVASTVQRYAPYLTVVIGIVLVALGFWLLAGREIGGLSGSARFGGRWAPTAKTGSMFGYGVGYAIASLSCTIGPFLAVTGSSARGGSVLDGLLAYVAYAAGLALVVGVLAVAVAFANAGIVERMRQVLPYVNRISGAVLVAVGVYVGYYGIYEIRLFGGGNAHDPVIDVVARMQRAAAGWVYEHGGGPWVLALVALLAAGAGAGWAVRRRRRRAAH